MTFPELAGMAVWFAWALATYAWLMFLHAHATYFDSKNPLDSLKSLARGLVGCMVGISLSLIATVGGPWWYSIVFFAHGVLGGLLWRRFRAFERAVPGERESLAEAPHETKESDS